MIDHFRADANLHFELDARMESDEATKRRRQRSAGDLLHHAESHPARKARCGEAITGYFLKLQQTTRITEQHFTVIGEPDTARRAPEQPEPLARVSYVEQRHQRFLRSARQAQSAPFQS